MAKSKTTTQNSLPLVKGLLVDADTEPMPPRHPRLPLALRVRSLEQQRTVWTTVDLSEGGLFVKGPPLFTPGTRHTLQIGLPATGSPVPLVCQAQVAWTNGPGPRQKTSYPCGMGLHFVTLAPAARRALRAFLGQCQPGNSLATAPDRPRAGRAIDVVAGAAASAPPIELVQTASVPATDEPAPARSSMLEPGSVFGPYQIVELLGAGSMGEVYLAEHRVLGRRVAIKRLCRHYAADPALVRRFFFEARRMSQLDHPNVVDVIDFIDLGSEQAYVMELLQGCSLSQLLGNGRPLPLERGLAIGQQLCDALAAVHAAGIVHRDVKPANVFLVDAGTPREQVKLLDFGVSRFVDQETGDSDNRTAAGALLGTPGYLAPEQIENAQVDQRADLYALGVVLYQMVTGRKPFAADSWPQLLLMHATQQPTPPGVLAPQPIPPPLDAIILRCLGKDPAQRPATAQAVGHALARIAAELAAGDQAHTIGEPSPSALRSLRWWSIGAALVAALATLAAWMAATYG